MWLRRLMLTWSAALLCMALAGCSMTKWSDFGIENDTSTTVVDSTEVTYTWTPPTTGSQVQYYILMDQSGTAWHATRAKRRITVPTEQRHRVRVRGVDADSNAGPWSEWSKWWPSPSGADSLDVDNPIGRGREWQR